MPYQTNKKYTAVAMYLARIISLLMLMVSSTAWAHDPIFGIGPHVLFKGGIEVAVEAEREEAGDETEQELALELTYGITGDWAAGIELPYASNEMGADKSNGAGDIRLFTKYRFWRQDSLGLQQSAAVLLKVKIDSGDQDQSPPLGTGTTDTLLGLTYGYEGRKWYRWASLRYRFNDENDAGIDRGDKILFDLVGGVRPTLTSYLEPDTVWLLELNGEYGQESKQNGTTLLNTGGTELFLAPGIFWTRHNLAVKAGVQIPIYSDLNGTQDESDYRAKVVIEWHL
jgi:hypothetical protein